jgi:hypothetical protein
VTMGKSVLRIAERFGIDPGVMTSTTSCRSA